MHRTTTLEELINLNNKADSKCSTAENSSAPGQNILALRNRQPSMVGQPATNLKSDTLKQAMEKLTTSRSSCSFIVDEHGHVEGVVTVGQFAGLDSSSQPADPPHSLLFTKPAEQCFSLPTNQLEQCFQPSFRPANGAHDIWWRCALLSYLATVKI